jgi:hypothetical protein
VTLTARAEIEYDMEALLSGMTAHCFNELVSAKAVRGNGADRRAYRRQWEGFSDFAVRVRRILCADESCVVTENEWLGLTLGRFLDFPAKNCNRRNRLGAKVGNLPPAVIHWRLSERQESTPKRPFGTVATKSVRLPFLNISLRLWQSLRFPRFAAAAIPIHLGIAEPDETQSEVVAVEAFGTPADGNDWQRRVAFGQLGQLAAQALLRGIREIAAVAGPAQPDRTGKRAVEIGPERVDYQRPGLSEKDISSSVRMVITPGAVVGV